MTKYVGIDLGTANTLLFCEGKGIVLNEPSVVAIHNETGNVLAVGKQAKEMIGRTPEKVSVIKPLKNGVISDFEVTRAMLKTFLDSVLPTTALRPRVTVCVPFGVTEVEKRAMLEVVERSGGKHTLLLEEPMAAALGANLPVYEATGSLIVDIGGGTAEVAVVSLGGIVTSTSLRAAGDKMDEDVQQFIKAKYGVLIGLPTAERVKIAVGIAHPSCEETTITVMGRDLFSGLPKPVTVTSKEVREAIIHTVSAIVGAIRVTLERTPPELSADIVTHGLYLTGGGANLPGIDRLVAEQTGIRTFVCENAQNCVAEGAGKAQFVKKTRRLFRRKRTREAAAE